MNAPLPSRRTVLRAGALTALTAGVAGTVSEWATAARAAVPTASSRAALAVSAGCATLTPEETQGPFWVDERLHRSDIRTDSETGAVQAGIPLTLTIRLQERARRARRRLGRTSTSGTPTRRAPTPTSRARATRTTSGWTGCAATR